MTTHSVVAGASAEESVAAAVLRCSAVARLHGGGYNAITSYLPGRRVVGVVVTPSAVTVGVVGRYRPRSRRSPRRSARQSPPSCRVWR